jgi:predicted metal-dependent phosphoesterase TrpH
VIDLHMHSTFSDGSLTPEQLVEMGRSIGLTAMALTDHDCTAGVGRFVDACAAGGIRGVTGVEISADVRRGTMHVLGYFVEPGHERLERVLERIRDGRQTRNLEILDRLNRLGFALSWEEVKAYAGEDVVGRPHFAQALEAKGYVSSKMEAFDLYLGKGKKAYAERFRMSPADSIAAIRGAGGIAVLAHPFTLDLKRDALRAAVCELRDAGLAGIEACYSEHSLEQEALYRALAGELGLAVTGGSDFHGDANPAIRMGTGFGTLNVPDEFMADLDRRAAR